MSATTVCSMDTVNQDTYERIAKEFSETRSYVWNCIKDFTQCIRSESESYKRIPNIIEVGCGNGKNMEYIKQRVDCNIVGIDSCHAFIDICEQKGLEASFGFSNKLAFPDQSFDYLLCIAMFHHLLTDEDRNTTMKEILRVMKPNSYGILTCWSTIQPEKSNFRFHEGVNIVPWKGRKNNHTTRYYNVYSEQMFREYFQAFSEIDIVHIYNEFGNWILTFRRK